MFRNLLFCLGVIFLFSRCSEEVQTTDSTIGREYYPLQVGNYWVYDVTETRVINNQYDSVKYQVRELIDTVFQNAAKEPTYQIVLSRRTNSNAAWGSDSLILVNKSLSDVRRTQNNIKKISLIFPVKEGKQWDANAFNTLDLDDYSYAAVNQPFVLHNINYDATVTIIQGEPNEVSLDDRKEVYAYQVGLIYKNHTVYEYAQIPPENFPDPTRVAKGFRRVLKLDTFHKAD